MSDLSHFDVRAYFTPLTEIFGDTAKLIIHGGDSKRRVCGANDAVRERQLQVVEIDGVPHTVCVVNPRYVRGLRTAPSVDSAYQRLRQKLTDADIRTFFYEFWLAYNNELARRERAGAVCKRNYDRNRGVVAPRDADASAIRRVTGGMSVRTAARVYGRI